MALDGNVGRGRSYSFIGDVHAINLDAGGAAEAASERDRRVAGFGGVEVLTILNLHARLKLGQIKEVATIHRQVGDLIFRDHALNGWLLGVHRN